MHDLFISLKKYQLWCALGWNDVLGKYRRSILGPLWITISMTITISAMGPLYSSLFGAKVENFILHLTIGIIFWGFISSIINESCNILNDSSAIIKQTDLPFYIYILRVFYRQFIILLHNCIIIPVVIIITHISINIHILLIFPALLITSIMLISVGMSLALFTTRYRDMNPVIQSIITLLFFITPVIWSSEQLPLDRKHFIDYNIMVYFLEIIRRPLMGTAPNIHIWVVAICTTFITTLISIFLIKKYKDIIVYWL